MRTRFSISLTSPSAVISEDFGWDDEVFGAIARTSLDAAFCDADTKARIGKSLGDRP